MPYSPRSPATSPRARPSSAGPDDARRGQPVAPLDLLPGARAEHPTTGARPAGLTSTVGGGLAEADAARTAAHHRTTDHGPRTTAHGPHATGHGPRATRHGPHATGHGPRAARPTDPRTHGPM